MLLIGGALLQARENLTAAVRKALNWNRPFADRLADVRSVSFASVDDLGAGQIGALMRPIATPLVMSGFDPEMADLLGSADGFAVLDPS